MATVQPMGQALQIPTVPKGPERRKAKATRRTRSVKVAAINCFISPAPRRMPSDTNLAEMTK